MPLDSPAATGSLRQHSTEPASPPGLRQASRLEFRRASRLAKVQQPQAIQTQTPVSHSATPRQLASQMPTLRPTPQPTLQPSLAGSRLR